MGVDYISYATYMLLRIRMAVVSDDEDVNDVGEWCIVKEKAG